MPILHAPILEQAGFTLGSQGGSNSYVYRLDGVNNYYQLSDPISILVGDIVEISFIGGNVTNSFATLIGTTNFAARFDTDTTSTFLREQGLQATLNGSPVDSGTTNVPTSGFNKASLSILTAGVLEQITSISGARLINLPVYNFKVIRGGTVIHEIPLTNKAQGATQLPTIGSVSATIVGYNENDWEEV